MSALGAWNAINFDGGGSTALAVQGADGNPDLLNRPSGGGERYDGANLGIYAAPQQPVPLPPALALFAPGPAEPAGFPSPQAGLTSARPRGGRNAAARGRLFRTGVGYVSGRGWVFTRLALSLAKAHR